MSATSRRWGPGFAPAHRRVVTLMVVTGVVQGFATALLTATLPFVRLDLGVSEGGMSLVLAATRAGSLVALPLAAYGDQKGRRRAFLGVFLLLCLSTAATAFVPDVLAFALAQSLVRASTVAISALAAVLLAEILAPAIRAFGMSFYAAAGSLGGGLALMALPMAEQADGWRTLYLAGGLGLVAFPLLAIALRESPIFRPQPRRVPLSVVLAPAHAPRFWRLAVVSFLVAAFASPGISFVVERLVNDLGWSAGDARLLLIGTGVLGASGLFVGGRIADLWGRRPTAALALGLGLAGGLGVYWFEQGMAVGPSLVAAGFGSSAFVPAFSAHRSELFPTSIRTTAGAWINNAGIVGGLASFLFGAAVFDRIGVSLGITILGLGTLVAVWMVLSLPETRGLELIPG